MLSPIYASVFLVFFFKFLQQNSLYISPTLHICYMLRPFHSSRFDYPNNIWRGVQILKVLIVRIQNNRTVILITLECSIVQAASRYKTTDIYIYIYVCIYRMVGK